MRGQILSIGMDQEHVDSTRNNLATLSFELVPIDSMVNLPLITERTDFRLIYLNTLALPARTGKETINQLRSSTHSPIISIALYDEIEEILVAGADMCFAPETEHRLVFMHMMAILRRFELYDSYDRGEYGKTILYRGNLVIDPWRQRLTRNGKEIPLLPREFRLLTYMAQNPEIVLTPIKLSKAIWSEDDSFAQEVPKAISELRRRLGDTYKQPKYIQTIRGVGYRFLFSGPKSKYDENCYN